MQKYRLVYETEKEQIDIMLIGKGELLNSILEISFIDEFTTLFENEQKCIEYLYQKNIIQNTNGKLVIKRPKGKVPACDVIYDDNEFNQVAKQNSAQLKQTEKASKLRETSIVVKCQSNIIKFFYNEEEAIQAFKQAFYFRSKALVDNLEGYLAYKNHEAFYEPGETERRDRFKREAKSILRNYQVLRNVYVWITKYSKTPEKTYSGVNPFEEYERKQDEKVKVYE